ncbi:Hypothetical protein HDN1F_01910 [gamma proteobacterium HdN1]|nr:Hypothetical protein HDN1F_01910 [gamma proteobacterium HdN1]
MIARLFRFGWRSLLVLAVVPLLLTAFLLFSNAGLRVLLHSGLSALPNLTVEDASGSILTGFTLHNLRYVDSNLQLNLDQLALDLSPRCLLKMDLCVERLAIGKTTLEFSPASDDAPDFDFPAISLPPIHLPIRVDVQEASLQELKFLDGEDSWAIRDGLLRFRNEGDVIFLDDAHTRIEFSGLTIHAAVNGSLDLRGETAASLSTQVKLDFGADLPDLDIGAEIRGSALSPKIEAVTHGLVEAEATIGASFRETGWPVNAQLKQNAPIQLVDEVPITLGRTVAAISGHINRWHVEGTTTVGGIPETPDVEAKIITDGDFFGLDNGTVDLAVGDQRAQLAGKFTWYPKLFWDVESEFSQIDAATWIPDVQSNVNAKAHVTGEWFLDLPFRNHVEIRETSGTWQNHPIQLATDLTHTADSLDVREFSARVGSNRALFSGKLASTWDFNGTLQLPALQELLPTLAGGAEGQLKLTGALNAPEVALTLASKNLVLQGEQLRESKLQLHGTLEKHELNATAQWNGYQAQAKIAGAWIDEHWRGSFAGTQVSKDGSSLRINPPAMLVYAKEENALTLEATCLQAVPVSKQPSQLPSPSPSKPLARTNPSEALCIDAKWRPANDSGTVALRAQQFDPDFLIHLLSSLPVSPKNTSWLNGKAGRWTGNADATLGSRGISQAQWQLNGEQIHLNELAGKPITPSLDANHIQLKGQLRQKRIDAEAQIHWNPATKSQFSIQIPNYEQPQTQTISLQTDPIPIRWAAPWVDAITLREGTFSGAVSGTIQRGWPDLSGELQLLSTTLGDRDAQWGLEALDLHLSLRGESAELRGAAQDDRGLHWQLSTPLVAHWSQTSGEFTFSQGCLSSTQSVLCGKGYYALKGGLDLTLDAHGNVSPWLALALDDSALIDGPFEGQAHFYHRNGELHGEARLGATLTTTAPLAGDDTPPTVQANIDAALTGDALTAKLSLLGEQGGKVQGELRADLHNERALVGHIDIQQVDLAPLRSFVTEADKLDGQINGRFTIGGRLALPAIEGDLQLSEGRFSSAALPISFTGIAARAHFTQQSARVDAEMRAGKDSQATLKSTADWSSGKLLTHSSFQGQQLLVKQGSDINLRADTNLTLASDGERLTLGGLVHLKEGFIRIVKLPENSVDVSKDALYTDSRKSLEPERALNVDVNVGVQISDLIKLEGFGADVRMNGVVGIQRIEPNDPEGHGVINISEGTYTGYGQKLKITKGQILFNGPVDNPVLSITAVREILTPEGTTVTAGINITGTPQQPESSLFSTPAMPEQDILSYIVLGRSRESSGSTGSFAMNQALLTLGLYGTGDYTRDLASKVGIDDFEISTSTDNDNNDSINVGGYLSPRLFVQYGVGLNTPVNTLTLRYRLTQKIFLEALSGAENALDILYSFEVQ